MNYLVPKENFDGIEIMAKIYKVISMKLIFQFPSHTIFQMVYAF